MAHDEDLRTRARALVRELDHLQELGLRFQFPQVLPPTEMPPGDPLVREFAEAVERVGELRDRLVREGWVLRVRVRLWLEED